MAARGLVIAGQPWAKAIPPCLGLKAYPHRTGAGVRLFLGAYFGSRAQAHRGVTRRRVSSTDPPPMKLKRV
jgi:hypothetical protein